MRMINSYSVAWDLVFQPELMDENHQQIADTVTL